MKKILLAVSALAVSAASASAADLPARSYVKAPATVASVDNWTGFYVGGNLGGQWGRSDPTTQTIYTSPGYFAATSVSQIAAVGQQHINSSNVTGGLTAGYNWQVSSIVAGIEADINYFGFKGSASSGAAYTCPACTGTGFTLNSSVSADWLATIRGRLGLLASPNLLLYGTGGAAIAGVKADFGFTDTWGPATESAAIRDTRIGWTAGAGAEYRVGGGWSLKAEYLYVDLGRSTVTSTNLNWVGVGAQPLNVFTHTADIKSNIGRIGMNHKFGGP